jgi:hypothetical protein
MKILLGFFIFCLILFFYLHIQFHLKESNELEIYEIEQASKDKIEEICDLRQPVLFNYDEECMKITNKTNKKYLLDNYPIFEIKIRDCNDISNENDMYIPLALHIASKLFNDDKSSNYISENNSDFLTETGSIKNMSYNDYFLRPHLVSNCNYDVMFASTNATTPFRYEINYRNYFLVTQGFITIKLAPPKSSKYLYPDIDYENLEFKSNINPWNPQQKYQADFDKIKCLEIILQPGKFLFIPAYWWYSFKFSENTSVSCFRYRTYMNNIAISPHIFMYTLQNQNIKRNFTKKNIDFLNRSNESITKDEHINLTNNNNNNIDIPNCNLEKSVVLTDNIIDSNISSNSGFTEIINIDSSLQNNIGSELETSIIPSNNHSDI